MSIVKHIDVFCDICYDWAHGDGARRANDARKVVRRKYGWKSVKRDGKIIDICPKCLQEEKEETHQL